jgi:tetraacyldisaccharide 4'-kinase
MREVVLKIGPKGRLKSFTFLQVERWMQEKKGFIPAVLSIFSYIWKLVVWIRHKLYQHKIMSLATVRPTVLNIGSIEVGGVGKTPLVMNLLESLSCYKRAVLTRGYESWNGVGDEALMIQAKYPEVNVKVGKNRLQNARELEKTDVEVLILDDGWQYRKLKGDFSVAVLNKDFTKEPYLPRGRLRDLPSRLTEADLIVVTHPAEGKECWEEMLRPYTLAPIIFAKYSWKRIYWMGEQILLAPGDKVAVFCGIGSPDSFSQIIVDQGFEIVCSMILKDHEKPLNYHLEELIRVAKQRGAKALLCTEKDFIKLEKSSTFPLGMVEVNYNVIEGDTIYQSFLEAVRKGINERSKS